MFTCYLQEYFIVNKMFLSDKYKEMFSLGFVSKKLSSTYKSCYKVIREPWSLSILFKLKIWKKSSSSEHLNPKAVLSESALVLLVDEKMTVALV